MSVPFCPIPSEGETIYSILCRSWERSGIPEYRLIEAFTGQPLLRPMLSALPGYLPTFSRSVPFGHPLADVNVAVRCHTLLSYFTYFDPPERRIKAHNTLATQDLIQPVLMALGLTRYTSPSCQRPRFCNECVAVDQREHGFSYFHREHQAPGVALCWRHKCTLAQGCAFCAPYSLRSQRLRLPGRCFCPGQATPLLAWDNLPADTEALQWIANESAYILGAKDPKFANVRERIRSLLIEYGLSHGENVSYTKVAEALENRFGAEVLNWLGYPAWRNGKPSSWILSFLKSPTLVRRSSSMSFLLAIGLLDASIKSFESRIERPTVREVDSREDVVDQSSLSRRDMVSEDCPPDWTTRLLSMLGTNSMSIETAVVQLQVNRNQLIREAIRQEIRIPLDQAASKPQPSQILEIHADLISGMPQARVAEKYEITTQMLIRIQADSPGLHQRHRKAATARNLHKRRLLSGFDWAERDKEIRSRLPKIVDHLRLLPTRITRTAILTDSGALATVTSRPEMFPLIQDFLRLNAEQRNEYVQRKIKLAIHEMSKAGQAISLSNLYKKKNLPYWELVSHKQTVVDAALDVGAMIHRPSSFES